MSRDAPPKPAPAKLALVTGGVRRLGAAIAERLAQDGYALALSSHNSSDAEDGLLQALNRHGNEWKIFSADLSSADSAATLINEVSLHFGHTPDLLVNNAAIFGQDRWTDIGTEQLTEHFELNLFAPILLSAELVRQAGEKARPCIIHILDQRIRNPHGDQLSYSLSKQALAGSVRMLAAAMEGRARVNGVAPGLVLSTDDYSEEQLNRLGDMMPLKKLPSPESVAQAVSYLASAQDVTGQILFADGGANLKSFDRDFLHL